MVDHDEREDLAELTVQRMAEMHAEHERKQSRLQRRIASVTSFLSRPTAVALFAAVILVWIGLNTAAAAFGLKAWDAAPFALLELIATLVALLTTLIILATQAKEEEAARHRAQLTLQLASLSEQKIAKVIALVEELRRDLPGVPSRADAEAADLSKPSDPREVMQRIRDTHDGGT